MSNLPLELPESALNQINDFQEVIGEFDSYDAISRIIPDGYVLYALTTRVMTVEEEIRSLKPKKDWHTLPLSNKVSVLILIQNQESFRLAARSIQQDFGAWVSIPTHEIQNLIAGV